jgi:hypothetical protein
MCSLRSNHGIATCREGERRERGEVSPSTRPPRLCQ